MPKVQNIIKNWFGRDVEQSVPGDEAVAIGATIQAALLNQTEASMRKVCVIVVLLCQRFLPPSNRVCFFVTPLYSLSVSGCVRSCFHCAYRIRLSTWCAHGEWLCTVVVLLFQMMV